MFYPKPEENFLGITNIGDLQRSINTIVDRIYYIEDSLKIIDSALKLLIIK